MIYLLTAIGLPPSGSSTVHINIETIHKTTQKSWKRAGRAPSFPVIPWHFSYNWGKTRRNLSQGRRRVPAGTL